LFQLNEDERSTVCFLQSMWIYVSHNVLVFTSCFWIWTPCILRWHLRSFAQTKTFHSTWRLITFRTNPNMCLWLSNARSPRRMWRVVGSLPERSTSRTSEDQLVLIGHDRPVDISICRNLSSGWALASHRVCWCVAQIRCTMLSILWKVCCTNYDRVHTMKDYWSRVD
jgi:hypothetical protein